MAIYFIGLGLADNKDITLKGLETLKKCDFVYLETYTSILQKPISELETAFGKEIISADRDMVEKNSDHILDNAVNKDVAFLVIGDPMCATTHIDLLLRAKEKGISVEIINNASIISAIGVLGLEVYKFGKITSIPFHYKNVQAPVKAYKDNKKIGLHTLFLLDLDPKINKFLSIKEAASYLAENGIDADTLAVGCSRIGSKTPIIKAGKLSNIGKYDYGNPPYCIVIPGKLHFIEEEALKLYE